MEKQFYEVLENILETKVDENTNLSMENCKNWTSLAHIDIIMSLEEEFEIKFSKDELSQLKSQNELLKAIKEKLC
ncbi:acyl carrier protein [Campylobacter coli]|nr:acyl carrier protein [Campylobacter coli]